MKKIQFGLTEEQKLIADGCELVPTDRNDITKPVLVIPPLGSDERPYLRMADGARIEITNNMCDAIYRYVDRDSAADDLEYFMKDEIEEDGTFAERADEIEENKEDIIDNYIERRNGAEERREDMRAAVEWTLGL